MPHYACVIAASAAAAGKSLHHFFWSVLPRWTKLIAAVVGHVHICTCAACRLDVTAMPLDNYIILGVNIECADVS